MIRFSIITCTYQAAAVLQRTLDSVLHQSYPHLEHIILDGASTDDTVSMVKHYMEENEAQEDCIHDIIFTSERDNGLYDAMNKGIMKATGDYLVFLNAGDVFPSPDTLEHIAGCVGEGETLPGVLYGDTDIVDNNGLSCATVGSLRPKSSHGVRSAVACWCAIKPFMPAQTSPNKTSTTCISNSLPTSTGASE